MCRFTVWSLAKNAVWGVLCTLVLTAIAIPTWGSQQNHPDYAVYLIGTAVNSNNDPNYKPQPPLPVSGGTEHVIWTYVLNESEVAATRERTIAIWVYPSQGGPLLCGKSSVVPALGPRKMAFPLVFTVSYASTPLNPSGQPNTPSGRSNRVSYRIKAALDINGICTNCEDTNHDNDSAEIEIEVPVGTLACSISTYQIRSIEPHIPKSLMHIQKSPKGF